MNIPSILRTSLSRSEIVIRRLPVINEKKRMVGMLSLGDLSHRVPHALSGEVIQAVSSHHS